MIRGRKMRSPLPKGEGQGEGKGNVKPAPTSPRRERFGTRRKLRSRVLFRLLPPHPSPLPWGEGEAPGALVRLSFRIPPHWNNSRDGKPSPSPRRRGPG